MLTITIDGAVVSCDDDRLGDVLDILMAHVGKVKEPSPVTQAKPRGKTAGTVDEGACRELAAIFERAMKTTESWKKRGEKTHAYLAQVLSGSATQVSHATIERYMAMLGITGEERRKVTTINGGLPWKRH